MKKIYLLNFILLFGFIQRSFSSNYDYELNSISEKFIVSIPDKDECNDLMNEAEDIKDEIESLLEDEQGLSNYERSALKKFQSEAEALEEFINSVGDINSSYIRISDIYLANSRIKAKIESYKTDNPNIGLMKISIGKYVCYLLSNDTYSNYKVTYKWDVKGKINKGNGEMGLPKKTARNFFNNRENLTINSINVFGIEYRVF